MAYQLTTGELNEYLCERVNPLMRGQTLPVITARVSSLGQISLWDSKENKFDLSSKLIVPKNSGYDRVEMAMTPHIAGITEKDVTGFLETMIDSDQIFQVGQPLFGHSIPANTLRRERSEKNKMICLVIDKTANLDRVRKAVYEAMFRPWLYYAIKGVGNYSG